MLGCRVEKLMNMFLFFQFVSLMCLCCVKRKNVYVEILHECLDYQGYNGYFSFSLDLSGCDRNLLS